MLDLLGRRAQGRQSGRAGSTLVRELRVPHIGSMRALVLSEVRRPLQLVERPDPTPGLGQVLLRVRACAVCRTDLHLVDGELPDPKLPIVPGHEIVGEVTKIGSAVTKFKPGDLAAVGCMVDSDRTCDACKQGLEQYCPNNTLTYNSPDTHLGGVTYGG